MSGKRSRVLTAVTDSYLRMPPATLFHSTFHPHAVAILHSPFNLKGKMKRSRLRRIFSTHDSRPSASLRLSEIPFRYFIFLSPCREISPTVVRMNPAAPPRSIELMAPAGSWASLSAALKAGADSLYFGVGEMNMRARSANTFAARDLG